MAGLFLATTDDNAYTILAIPDSTHIQISGQFTTVFSGGGTVFSCGYTFSLSSGSKLIGPGTIDGNRANFTIARWQNTNEVRFAYGTSFSSVQGIEIKNAPGEGVIVYGNYHSALDMYIHDLNGNGVHFTDSPVTMPGGHIVCSYVHIYNCNLDFTVGHPNGGIIWSDTITDATISDCLVDTTPLQGIGKINEASNSDVTVTGNTIRNCLQSGVGLTVQLGNSSPTRIVIANNRITNCGYGDLASIDITMTTGSPTQWPNRIAVTGNVIDCTSSWSNGMNVRGAKHVTISGNILDATTLNVPAYGINVNTSDFVTISGNNIICYSHAIVLSTARNTTVSGNVLDDQLIAGIWQGADGVAGCCISGNTIYSTQGSFIGLIIGDQTSVTGNSIFLDCNSATAGISVTGSNNSVTGNLIRSKQSGCPTTGIVVTAVETGNVIANNSITSFATTAINLNSTSINDTTAGNGNYTVA